MRISRKRLTISLVPAVGLVAAMLVFAPAAAQATITEGHPEAFESGIKVGGKEKSAIQVGWGQIHLESAQLGSEGIECVNLGFGSGYNEGSPLRAYGQILSWTASGHVPEGTHTELSSSCRPHGEAAKPGSFATDELNTKAEEPIEPKNRKLTVPWNVELTCGVREEEFQGIVKTGIPNSAFPGANTKCPAEASETTETEEIESYKAERTGKKGCYATNPAPEGCIRVTIVEPGAGLEVAYGGTLHAHGINGVHNGLSPTRWVFATTSGELQCEAPAGCVATGTTTGTVKEDGYNSLALITGK